ncbi:DNA (cytosine-5-)-methyltransferase [Microbacterium paludicola]|uniref:Cytosine-specific methyltransferase n=1 Tax=Microbacterium paludicola TaxID=300019 RepID=A0A4Y9FQQ5_9MICO|nr:DNA (cytosine-5-)-methyltransferase [Microbacterium paludicola]TFU30588.1 DNA (cytosine-5-)-methyltransferase [Microbacterium paludicola]
MTFRMGELFSGPGGMALGAHQAAAALGVDLRHGWANDYDASTVATYVANIHGASHETVRHADVRELNIEELGHIEGFAFGFPCNDYSLVGENRGLKGEFGPLYKFGIDVLDHYKPMWFVAENVSGLRSSNGGRDFAEILKAMRTAADGYVLTPHLYKFEEYGVPQRRHRIIIVGIRSDVGAKFRVPAPTHPRAADWVPVRDVLLGIPESAKNHERTRQSQTVMERLSYIDPGENAFNAKRMPDHLKLNVRGATLSQIYRRLHPERPSYTLTGSGGGGTHGYHWAENRALTNRERARIQTFPDEFEFKGPKESVRRQVGMAVPPAGARVIFEALFKTMSGQPYQWIEQNLAVTDTSVHLG